VQWQAPMQWPALGLVPHPPAHQGWRDAPPEYSDSLGAAYTLISAADSVSSTPQGSPPRDGPPSGPSLAPSQAPCQAPYQVLPQGPCQAPYQVLPQGPCRVPLQGRGLVQLAVG